MKAGDIIRCRALHADGNCYRHWMTTVEYADDEMIVTYSPAADESTDLQANTRVLPYGIRGYYWHRQPYNLFECLLPNGDLDHLYANVANPPTIDANTLSYTDYELDVYARVGEPAKIVDEDEFAEAALQYGYTDTFQKHCRDTAIALLAIVQNWQPQGDRR